MPDPVETRTDEPLTRGQRVAGALMFLKGAVSVGEWLQVPEQLLGRLAGGGGPVVLMDMIVGAMLLAGWRSMVQVAVLLAGFRLVMLSLIRVQQDEPLLAAAQVAVGVGLLLLLVKSAGLPRIVGGAALVGFYLVVEVRQLAGVLEIMHAAR